MRSTPSTLTVWSTYPAGAGHQLTQVHYPTGPRLFAASPRSKVGASSLMQQLFVQDLARELADLAAQLAALKGEAYNWLSAPDYAALRHRLEDAHASVEAAAMEARRRVRLQRSSEGRER